MNLELSAEDGASRAADIAKDAEVGADRAIFELGRVLRSSPHAVRFEKLPPAVTDRAK